MQVLSVVAVFIGSFGYMFVFALTHQVEFVIDDLGAFALGLVLFLGTMVAVVIAHEGVHGLAMAAFGARPRFGFTRLGGTMPAFFCTADGHRFTQGQFLGVGIAPTLVVGGLIAVLVTQPWAPLWLPVVGALHLGGCVGDWMMMRVAGRQPRGTLVEDCVAGMRFHPVG